jgi:predicted HicB family RNase H-like nuclease
MDISNCSDHYAFRIEWSKEDNEYVGLCTELPSVSWLAPTREGALQGIKKVVCEILADMKKHGEVPPVPLAGKEYSGTFKVRIPPFLHRKLALEAARNQVSLNRLISAKLADG